VSTCAGSTTSRQTEGPMLALPLLLLLLAASCPVKEKHAEGRFALVGYRVE
jgi:hypothetical protein